MAGLGWGSGGGRQCSYLKHVPEGLFTRGGLMEQMQQILVEETPGAIWWMPVSLQRWGTWGWGEI